MKWIWSLAFGIGGLAVLAAGLALGFERYKLYRTGIHAQGKVVEQLKTETQRDPFNVDPKGFRTQQTMRTVTTYNPVVEFQTASGQKLRFRDDVSSQNSLETAAGTVVDVVYDPGNPANARIGRPLSQIALHPLLMILAGIVFAAFAVRGLFRD